LFYIYLYIPVHAKTMIFIQVVRILTTHAFDKQIVGEIFDEAARDQAFSGIPRIVFPGIYQVYSRYILFLWICQEYTWYISRNCFMNLNETWFLSSEYIYCFDKYVQCTERFFCRMMRILQCYMMVKIIWNIFCIYMVHIHLES
jgi:hypothetical protein